GSNIPEIKEFFWKWRRHHYPRTESSLTYWSGQLFKRNEIGMSNLGIFGATVVEEYTKGNGAQHKAFEANRIEERQMLGAMPAAPAEAGFGGGRAGEQADGQYRADNKNALRREQEVGPANQPGNGPEPSVRKNFADTAYWTAGVTSNKDGVAEFSFNTPDQ